MWYKDIARYEVIDFVEENFGINIETECENVEEEIDYYVEKYGIVFDEEGKELDTLPRKETNFKVKKLEFF